MIDPRLRRQTPAQTIGPFFGYALPVKGGSELVPAHDPSALRLHGLVFDGRGDPVPDALIEIWQADKDGVIPQRQGSLARLGTGLSGVPFTGFGRCPTTRAGEYGFTTMKPGSVAGGAPYVLVTVFARGMPQHLFTRCYFSDEEDANATNSILNAVPLDRRSTLLAVPDGPRSYHFDIRLQGERETVFLDFDE